MAAAQAVLQGTSGKNIILRLLPFFGLAFIASIAYMDPGNFATNIQGGAQFGYLLLWVILASSLTPKLIANSLIPVLMVRVTGEEAPR